MGSSEMIQLCVHCKHASFFAMLCDAEDCFQGSEFDPMYDAYRQECYMCKWFIDGKCGRNLDCIYNMMEWMDE